MPVCPHPSCTCGHKDVAVATLIRHVLSSPWAALYYCSICKCVCRSESVLQTHNLNVHKSKKSAPLPVAPGLPRAQSAPPVRLPPASGLSSGPAALVSSQQVGAALNPSLGGFRPPQVPVSTSSQQISTAAPSPSQMKTPPVVPLQPPPVPVPQKPTMSCATCGRSYPSTMALQQHYRDSPAHPKCSRCNLGFVDNASIQSHVSSVHQPISCAACNGLQVYREDVANHYRISSNHPTCMVCNLGFEDAYAFDQHINSKHPEFRCRLCNVSFGSAALLDEHYHESQMHPRCPECQVSFADNLTLVQHVISVFNPLIRDFGTLILETPQMSLHDSRAESVKSQQSILPKGSPGFRSPAQASVASPFTVATAGPSQYRNLPESFASFVQDQREEDTDGFSPTSTRSSLASISSPSIISLLQTPSPQKGKMKAMDDFVEVTVPSPMTLGRISQLEFPLQQECSLPLAQSSPHAQTSDVQRPDALAHRTIRDDLTPAAPNSVAATISPINAAAPVVTAPSTGTSSEDYVDVFGTRSPSSKATLSAKTSPSLMSAHSLRLADSRHSPTPKPQDEYGHRVASPIPSHVVVSSLSQPERFKIMHSRAASRAESIMSIVPMHLSQTLQGRIRSRAPSTVSSRASFSLHSSEQLSPKPTAAPVPHSPHTELWQSALATPRAEIRDMPAPKSENTKLVSHIYCRLCRRDPCRQPTATMCGHIFCHSCISAEVKLASQCPVCDAPTLLYSLFRLQVA